MGWLRSRRRDWRRLRSLSRAQRRLLAQAMFALPLVVIAHRWLGLSRAHALLERLVGRRALAQAPCAATVREAARAVRIAATRGACACTCMQTSLLLWWLLARSGIRANLRIGVRLRGERLEAHAWLECRGVIVNEREDIARWFTPFERAILPAAGVR